MKERMRILEGKNSEIGFREQIELYNYHKKEEDKKRKDSLAKHR
jgi:hypothetical protein